MINNINEYMSSTNKLDSLIKINKKIRFNDPYENYYNFNLSVINYKEKQIGAFRSSSNIKYKVGSGIYNFISLAEINNHNLINVERIRFKNYGTHIWDKFNSFEDPRIFVWKDSVWCLFVRPTMKYSKTFMVLLNLENNNYIFLEDPFLRQHTKNWMPYVDNNDELYLITDVYPMKIFKLVDDKLELFLSDRFAYSNFNLCGSSNLINYNDKIIGIIHGKKFINNNVYYWHAFISLDKDMSNPKLGNPFYFEHDGVEFCTSILDNINSLCIYYSVNDCTMNMVEINKEELDKLL